MNVRFQLVLAQILKNAVGTFRLQAGVQLASGPALCYRISAPRVRGLIACPWPQTHGSKSVRITMRCFALWCIFDLHCFDWFVLNRVQTELHDSPMPSDIALHCGEQRNATQCSRHAKQCEAMQRRETIQSDANRMNATRCTAMHNNATQCKTM